VIQASRAWICIRPATYESEIETRIMLDYYTGFDGKVVNTVFCLLDPKGERLIRAGRSPGSIYASPAELAQAMQGFGESFAQPMPTDRSLPSLGSLRLALNVAACDSMPVVVGLIEPMAEDGQVAKALAQLCWADEFEGRAHYLLLERGGKDHKRLASFAGYDSQAALLMIMPDAFGQDAEVLAHAPQRAAGLAEHFGAALAAHEVKAKNPRRHIAEGKSKDLVWKSAAAVDE